MKYILIAAGLCLAAWNAAAQTVNWAALKTDQRHLVHLETGLDFGVKYQLGYSHQLHTKRPALLHIEQSHFAGDRLLEDFATRTGVQVNWIQTGDFHISTDVRGVFRRFENSLVRLANFGCDVSGAVGYYRPKWFVALEAGFDKAIVTNFKHSDDYREDFPGVQDGWYEPATGGNFRYGTRIGLSVRKVDLYLKAGNLITQDFKTRPFVPFYGDLGCTVKF